jgi:methylated-DNA-protein-cysteine methyltransferase-like protein
MKDGFFETVYEAVKRIPSGKVATYSQIARAAKRPRCARQVGWALHVNPMPGVIPCHRVVNREGATAPAFAFGGSDVQRRLLENEGVSFDSEGRVKREFFASDEELAEI